MATRDLRRMAWYFLDYGAATATILQNRLQISQPTTYRYMKDLKTFNFISLAIRARKARGKRGGPRPEVWKVPNATTDHINEAQRLHRNLMSPKYLYAEEMAQLMLDEYILVKEITEVSRVEYIEFLRGRKVKPSSIPDIVLISIPIFREQGVTFLESHSR